MAILQDDSQSRGGSRTPKWAIAGAIFVGSLSIAVSVVVGTGTSLVNSPMAAATTTRATPWVPRPVFLPPPVKKPGTLISAQGANNGQNQQQGADWAVKATPPFEAISKGMNDLGNALNVEDLAGAQRACRAIAAAGQKLEATLPAPKDDLTAEVRATVDEINAMNSACLADPPNPQSLQQHATAANQHLVNVAKLAKGG